MSCLPPILAVIASLAATEDSKVQVIVHPNHQSITHLSWDTEGGDRDRTNLLRKGSGITAQRRIDQEWKSAENQVRLDVRPVQSGFDLIVRTNDNPPADAKALRLLFPFDPRVTPTTILPNSFGADGTMRLPAIVSAPDYGQMLVTAGTAGEIISRLTGSRKQAMVDWIVEIPWSANTAEATFQFRTARLAPPAGLEDNSRWRLARRGWFNGLTLTSEWGDQKSRFSAPAGVLGNNVLSDPASCSLWMYADLAFFVPELPGGIKTSRFLRRTLDHWLDHRVKDDGNVIGYWDYDCFLDSPPSILISAWDYVEMSGDRDWLASRITLLERIAGYLLSRDLDHDGLIEAVPTGNRGTLKQPNRSSCWFDAVNFGHKDGYANALIYRGFRCLADLEKRLGRNDRIATYSNAADRLKQAYAAQLLNPETGWLAMWKSADDELHDYASPIVNGLAIEYGLVGPKKGREILLKLQAKARAAGFINWQFGVPCVLDPVPPDDYLDQAIGTPKQKDGRDSFQVYMNGGITAGQGYHFLAALHAGGLNIDADRILDAMLPTQLAGGFQNGFQDAMLRGIDWQTWDGRPCGYEGFLADTTQFLLAALTRNAVFRDRLLRPVLAN